jgi:tripartite-type tricarboxylate transporter receptor subunit TctC
MTRHFSARRMALTAALAALFAGACAPSFAQHYPSKPIQLIVPFHPNGSTTVVMRHIAPLLSEKLGQQVVVINKPGSGGTIGMTVVANAAPDGYTLGVATLAIAANPSLQAGKRPYEVGSAFAPISLIARVPLVLTVNPALGVNSLQELLQEAKAKPGALNYGSAGVGSSGHLGIALLESAAGIRMTHIPFSTMGSGTSVANGDVQLQMGPIPSSLPLIQGGRMRALGLSGTKPVKSLPGVLPLAQQGLSQFEAYDWSGIVAPAGTPPAIVARLSEAIEEVLREPAVRSRIEHSGAEVLGGTPAAFESFLQQEIQKWTRVGQYIQTTEANRK